MNAVKNLVVCCIVDWLLTCVLVLLLLLQENIWGSTVELLLYLTNVSSHDHLHNLTCEAENQAGPAEEMVQLDIECECQQNKTLLLNTHRLNTSCRA